MRPHVSHGHGCQLEFPLVAQFFSWPFSLGILRLAAPRPPLMARPQFCSAVHHTNRLAISFCSLERPQEGVVPAAMEPVREDGAQGHDSHRAVCQVLGVQNHSLTLVLASIEADSHHPAIVLLRLLACAADTSDHPGVKYYAWHHAAAVLSTPDCGRPQTVEDAEHTVNAATAGQDIRCWCKRLAAKVHSVLQSRYGTQPGATAKQSTLTATRKVSGVCDHPVTLGRWVQLRAAGLPREMKVGSPTK